MIADTVELLPCLLLPVAERTLLLPSAAIAEIIPYQESEIEVLPDVPAWFLGMLSWRGVQVPLTNLEPMEPYLEWDGIVRKSSDIHAKKKCYIAIINRVTKINTDFQTQKFRQYSFFSFVLQDTPKLIRVSKDNLNAEFDSKILDQKFIMALKLKEEDVFVPDLVKFWKIINTLPARLQWLGKMISRDRGVK